MESQMGIEPTLSGFADRPLAGRDLAPSLVGKIRTCDPSLPKRVLFQAEPLPVGLDGEIRTPDPKSPKLVR
jgi:hypothetical protein